MGKGSAARGLYTATLLATMIVKGGLQRGFAQRRVARMLDAAIRQKFGVIIVDIKRADGLMEFNPPPEAVIRTGDELVVLGRPESVRALEEMIAV